MSIIINENLFQSLLNYLNGQVRQGDPQAQDLLTQLQACQTAHAATNQTGFRDDSLDPDLPSIPMEKFAVDLFTAWKSLAIDEVGENFWSYAIKIKDVADEMNMLPELLVQYLAIVKLDNLQLIQNRSSNYTVGKQKAASLTFHPSADSIISVGSGRLPASKAASKTASTKPLPEQQFQVGDRVRVNENRPQYANHTGVVEQIISVSCRVKLDNGWSAFLPKSCLEKLS